MAHNESCRVQFLNHVDKRMKDNGISQNKACEIMAEEMELPYNTLRGWCSEQRKLESEDNRTKTGPVFNPTNESISWAKWSWNPVVGCNTGCKYCYARDMAIRFPERYPNGFKPTFYKDCLAAPSNTVVPARSAHPGVRNVFVCSMADLFGEWVEPEWIDQVMDAVRQAPQWNFLFLTKNPKRLVDIDWPGNAWVGATVDTQERVEVTEKVFESLDVKVKFVSCEPMLENIQFSKLELFDMLIIGAQSKSTKAPAFQPDRLWVKGLMENAWDVGCKIYCKPNLSAYVRELPNEGRAETR